jgi:hypothetical protein
MVTLVHHEQRKCRQPILAALVQMRLKLCRSTECHICTTKLFATSTCYDYTCDLVAGRLAAYPVFALLVGKRNCWAEEDYLTTWVATECCCCHCECNTSLSEACVRNDNHITIIGNCFFHQQHLLFPQWLMLKTVIIEYAFFRLFCYHRRSDSHCIEQAY